MREHLRSHCRAPAPIRVKGLLSVRGSVRSPGHRTPLVQRQRVPEPHRPVARRRREQRAVGAELEILHVVGVTGEGDQELPGLRVPDADRAIPPARCEACAVGAELDAEDLAIGRLEPRNRDMVADNVDDLPLTPGVTSDFIESDLRALCATVKGLGLENFAAPNNNARKGRRNAMCNKLNSAAKKVAQDDYQSALDSLQSLLQKLDDENQPPDWMVNVDGNKDLVRDDVELMIFLIELVL